MPTRLLAEAIRQCLDGVEWRVRVAWDGLWADILQYGRHRAQHRPAGPDDHLCIIYFYGVADIVPVRQVALQTRLRLPANYPEQRSMLCLHPCSHRACNELIN